MLNNFDELCNIIIIINLVLQLLLLSTSSVIRTLVRYKQIRQIRKSHAVSFFTFSNLKTQKSKF